MPAFQELLMHALLAVEYRFMRSVAGSMEDFGDFRCHPDSRSPIEIINHMFDLVQKTRSMLKEGHFDVPSPKLLGFQGESQRFIRGLQELLNVVDEAAIVRSLAERLVQGPVLDLASHIGQLAMLNGLHGNKIPKVDYYSANLGEPPNFKENTNARNGE